MPIEENLGEIRDAAGRAIKKGEDWFREETAKLEELAGQGTEEAKGKLRELAAEYNVKVDDNMGAAEIKNKIKAKLREMK